MLIRIERSKEWKESGSGKIRKKEIIKNKNNSLKVRYIMHLSIYMKSCMDVSLYKTNYNLSN